MKPLARVHELWRYPVKSMAGEQLQEAQVYWYGIEGDRRYAFVDSTSVTSFPWLTAREMPQLVQFRPAYAATDVVNGPLQVALPSGLTVDIGSEALLQALQATNRGRSVRLMQLNRGTYDAAPLSLMSRATARYVMGTAGRPLDSRRYRQNLIVEAFDAAPYIEDGWYEKIIVFGDRPDSARLLVNRPIKRCQMINVDPQTAAVDARVLKAVVGSRDSCLGVYLVVVRPGTIAVGDTIYEL